MSEEAESRAEDINADSKPEVEAVQQELSVDDNLDVNIFPGTLRLGDAASAAEATPEGVDHLLERLKEDSATEGAVAAAAAIEKPEGAEAESVEELPLTKSSTSRLLRVPRPLSIDGGREAGERDEAEEDGLSASISSVTLYVSICAGYTGRLLLVSHLPCCSRRRTCRRRLPVS